MNIIIFVVLGIIGLGLLTIIMYFVHIYNGLIRLKHNINKTWSNIDVLLKQRHDEIPKLIKVCEGYMKYERDTLEKIIALRNQVINAETIQEKGMAEGNLIGSLRHLFALAENYPELKANQNFMQLQSRISALENQIADRREFYNDSVNTYNIRIHQIPDVFISRMLNYNEQELFQVDEEDKKDVDIKFNLP